MILARPGLRLTGKVESHYLALLDEFGEGRQGRPVAAVLIGHGIVGRFGRAEDPLDLRVVVKQRKEHRDAFDDRGPQLGFDPGPVLIEPALDGFELLLLPVIARSEPRSADRFRSATRRQCLCDWR